MISLSKLLKQQWYQVIVVVLLLLLLALGAFPGYITGKWQWKQPPPITNLQKLQNIRKVGLSIPGWPTIEQSQQQLGTHKWSWQRIKKQGTSTEAILLLLPQNGPKDQPEVEWTEINNWGRWDIAQDRSGEFTVNITSNEDTNTTFKVTANFFRAVTPQQTFAVLQWYAMPNAGNPSPLNWFFADQVAQWQHRRIYWVAVTILLPIEPLGEVETSWTEVQSLGQIVQQALITEVL
ncbi:MULTISPECIES: cyanoexosortase B system-associated protein [unclassified Anabaena]|uniref:cyanoexosortase B system-associated protein n=1 Tax=unclassified Anabaena TaxID=2619674 RepID=UPI0014482E58|nr:MULTISPECIES: cyanoexosortase B system-associated protein [unclassified Anabaena]MTJ10010.1 cyanoexosortase B system-associated protein [Anabaena sp. UHCC 0204]MTJ55748.1 cyanoexosortase B system-associated protein [Anabaena sp. UHCC 0253]